MATVNSASRGFERDRRDTRRDGRHAERTHWDSRENDSRDPHDN